MKWRLFQTKVINSFLILDLFAIATSDFSKGLYSGISPEALLTLHEAKLKWMFDVNYWRTLEERAASVLKHNDIRIIDRCRRAIERDYKIADAKLNSDNALDVKIETLIDLASKIIRTFLGPFESILPTLIARELGNKLDSHELGNLISKITQPEKLTFRGCYNRDIYRVAKKLY